MSSLPNHTIDRHPTPPLSPSTSLNSSAASSASSSCTSSHRGSLNHLSATRPDSQQLEYHDPAEKLGFMADRLEEDVVMLDDWEDDEEEEKRMSGIHGKRILEHIFQVAMPFPAHLMRMGVFDCEWSGG